MKLAIATLLSALVVSTNAGYLTHARQYPFATNIHSARNTHTTAVGGGPTSGSHSSVHYSQTVTVPVRISSTISSHPSLAHEHHVSNVAPSYSSAVHNSAGHSSSGHANQGHYNIGHTIQIQHTPSHEQSYLGSSTQSHYHQGSSPYTSGAHNSQSHSSQGHSNLVSLHESGQNEYQALRHSNTQQHSRNEGHGHQGMVDHMGPSASYSNTVSYQHGL